jgi:hypothetical protein
MPTRKQKRRELKGKRHDYEFVYLDGEGNELDEVPEELEQPKKERTNGSKPAAGKRTQPAARGRRQPPVPSWNRALKRGAMLGAVVLVLFSFGAKGHIVSVIPLALLYTALFVPFTFYIDRFAYKRWQARQPGGGGGTTPTKKR